MDNVEYGCGWMVVLAEDLLVDDMVVAAPVAGVEPVGGYYLAPFSWMAC
jgi:hypothetical protein